MLKISAKWMADSWKGDIHYLCLDKGHEFHESKKKSILNEFDMNILTQRQKQDKLKADFVYSLFVKEPLLR